MFNLKLAERQVFFISIKIIDMQIYYHYNEDHNIYGIISIEEIWPQTYSGDRPALLFTFKGNYHSAAEGDNLKTNYLEVNFYDRFYPEGFKFYSKPIPEDREALKQAFDYLFGDN